MISERLARRYVQALFEAAQASAETSAVRTALEIWEHAYNTEPRLRAALADPRWPAERKRHLLLRLLGEQEPPVLLQRFVDLLLRKYRLEVLAHSARIFERLEKETAGIQEAVVWAPWPLAEEQQQKLADVLERLLRKQIVLRIQEEPSVIGGLTVKVGDLLIDGSIKGRLERLRKHFERGEPLKA